jgi:hypothetical protein
MRKEELIIYVIHFTNGPYSTVYAYRGSVGKKVSNNYRVYSLDVVRSLVNVNHDM